MDDLADQLTAARKERSWSQSHLARRLEVDVKTVRRWEQGEYRPQTAHLEAIRRELPELATATEFEQLRADVAALRDRVEQLERQRSQNG